LVAAVVFALAHLPASESEVLLSHGPVAFRLGASLESLSSWYEEQAELMKRAAADEVVGGQGIREGHAIARTKEQG